MDGNHWQQLYDKGLELGSKYEPGVNLEHLSKAIGNLQEALVLCPVDAPQRVDILEWLGWALRERYDQERNLEDLTQVVPHFREALGLCRPGSPSRSYLLNGLAHTFKERYDREGNLEDLTQAIQYYQEALGFCGPVHPNRSNSLRSLASALTTRYNREGNLEDLAQAIQYDREALDLRGPGHPDRSESLNDLAVDLKMRYDREGSPEDLTKATQYHQEALGLCGPGNPNRSLSLKSLALALKTRYNREGNLEDLAQAIQYDREALDLRGPGHPDRSESLGDLAVDLKMRYDRKGNPEDLTQAIQYHREALDLLGPGHPSRSLFLNNLANALWTRYNREGKLEDLAKATQYHQEALGLHGPGHPNRSVSLRNLASALTTRYNREGNLEDLAQAIQYDREALDLRGPGHPDRSSSLNDLAVDLEMRYDREGNPEDLIQAIQYHREALELRGLGHPHQSSSLSNLAAALVTQYTRAGTLEDLVLAIQYHREALDLHGFGHPNRSVSLNNLADALQLRYNKEGNLEDLTHAIQYHGEALDLRGSGHPNRSRSLKRLANLLHLQRKKLRTGNNSIGVAALDLGVECVQPLHHANHSPADCAPPDPWSINIISMLREASQSQTCSPIDCLKAALDWIRISKDTDPISTIEAYTTAFNQIDVILALGRSLNQRQDRLQSDNLIAKTQGLGGEAAAWALQRGEPERAVELLEQSRTLLLAQIGRYRVELDDLEKVDSELADRFAELSRRLDASVVSNERLDEEILAAGDPYGGYWKLSIEWSEVADKIRAIPNFESFLKPASFNHLRNAAAEGPVIILIPNKEASDALIIHQPRSGEARIHHVPLPLAKSDRLAELSDNFIQALKPSNDRGNRMEGLCLPHLRLLWKEFVEPVAQALQHDLGIQVGSRVWWCPTSVVCSLPLHAAGMYSKGEGNFHDLYISSYTPTVQAIIRARQTRDARMSPPKKLFVVLQSASPPDSSQAAALDRSQPVALDDRSQLACATREAEVIAETLLSNWDVKTLSGKQGTCEAVQLAMDSHPWVHFICHGNQVNNHPLDSYLSLSDGPLTLHKIIERKLPNAEFAFLAACHSAAGDRALANEVLHLAAAVQFAGFRSVIGTLWKMRDDDGLPLAEAFYREMVKYGDGSGAAAALNKAFKNLRRKGSQPRVSINGLMRFVHIGI